MIFERIIGGQGIPLMVVGMSVVFTGLVILMFMMKGLKWFYYWFYCQKVKRLGIEGDPASCLAPEGIPEVIIAAISVTLILEEEEAHDDESMVLTLRALPKPYSNWWMRSLDEPWKAKTNSFREVKSGIED